jgi:hypothetical protein
VNDVRFALLKEYMKNSDTTTEEQADSFIKRWHVLDQDNTQLRLKYIPEFEKVISHKKTTMFFQIDRRALEKFRTLVLANNRRVDITVKYDRAGIGSSVSVQSGRFSSLVNRNGINKEIVQMAAEKKKIEN